MDANDNTNSVTLERIARQRFADYRYLGTQNPVSIDDYLMYKLPPPQI